jgi:rSAM/selenodomain-associated transferase 1
MSIMTSSSSSRVLGLFAKRPEPGYVKTRLAASVGAEPAARIAAAFLADTVQRLTQVDAQRILAYSPADALKYFTGIAATHFEVTPQADGDLGHRMAAFFMEQLAREIGPVVLVGTDSPTLPSALIEQAFRELATSDLVLGPATDGGYYLVGCRKTVPPIFEGITWSSSGVLGETVARLRDTASCLALLPPWYDVDTLDDWRTLQGHVAALRRAGLDPGVPQTERLLQVLAL